jgi:hypothetical protein
LSVRDIRCAAVYVDLTGRGDSDTLRHILASPVDMSVFQMTCVAQLGVHAVRIVKDAKNTARGPRYGVYLAIEKPVKREV